MHVVKGDRATIAFVVALLAFSGLLTGTHETLASTTVSTPPFAWDYQTADSNGSTGLHTSIALAGGEVPFISYLDGNNRVVRLAARVGANWSSEIVAGPGTFGGDTNVAIAPNGTIEMSYFDETQRAVVFAAKGSTGWIATRVDSGFSEGYNRLALDSSGRPSIVYTGFDGSLRLASWNDTRWATEIVDDTTVTSRYGDLAFDPLDRPHLSYYGNGTMLYAVKTLDGWTHATVDSTPRSGLYSRLRIDSRGTPHIAYYSSQNASLLFATRGPGGWALEVVDGQGEAGLDLSFAMDRQGRAQIAYYSRITGDLRYAIKTDQGWIRETVEAMGVVGWYTGIVVDSRGFPHISYYDWTEGILRYARGIIALQMRTLGATQRDSSSAVLRGELVALGDHPRALIEFALRVPNGGETTYQAGNLTRAGIASILVSNLTTDVTYEFQAVATAGNETSKGASLSFRISAPLPPSPPYALLLATGGIGAVVGTGILILAIRRRRRTPSDDNAPLR